jgi:hypothetical protein
MKIIEMGKIHSLGREEGVADGKSLDGNQDIGRSEKSGKGESKKR